MKWQMEISQFQLHFVEGQWKLIETQVLIFRYQNLITDR